MSVLQAEVYEAFRSIDVPDDKALKAAIALSAAMAKGEDDAVRSLKRVEDDTTRSFSKRDADIEVIRKDVSAIKLDVVALKGEMVLVRWMLGTLLAMVTTLLFRAFTH